MQAVSSRGTADPAYLFSLRIRRLLFHLGWFVAYSQLASTAFTGVYRYSPSEPAFVDGGSPRVFNALMLVLPTDHLGTINDLQAQGFSDHFDVIEYAMWAIVAPVLGSAALFLAYVTGARSATTKLLLIVGSVAGIAVAVSIKLYELKLGSIGWAMLSMTATDGPLVQPVHPVYGYVEFFGSLILPLLAYPAIILAVIVSAFRRIISRLMPTRPT